MSAPRVHARGIHHIVPELRRWFSCRAAVYSLAQSRSDEVVEPQHSDPSPTARLSSLAPIAIAILRSPAWDAQDRRVGVSCDRRCSSGPGVPVPRALAEVHAVGGGAAPKPSHVLGVGVFPAHCTRHAVVFRFLTRGGAIMRAFMRGAPRDKSAFVLWAADVEVGGARLA